MPTDRPNYRGRRIVPNRIFLAYPWEVYRIHYETVCAELHGHYPVYFFAVGRGAGVRSDDLYQRICSVIRTSTYAVFDASKGNANVSLEYGISEGIAGLDKFLLIDEHALPGRSTGGTPIIADLAGLTQNRWRIDSRESLKQQLEAIAKEHDYTKRFRRFCRRHGLRGGPIRGFLKIIRRFDERDEILRRELLDELEAESNSPSPEEISRRLTLLHDAGLLTVTRGNNASSRVWIT